MASDWDAVIRALVLEGAAGVPKGTWSNKGVRGLLKAKESFENAGSMDPEWFNPKGSKLYLFLLNNIRKRALSLRTPMEAEEVLTHAIMGLGADMQDVLSVPYAVGKHLSQKVKSGGESPRSVGVLVLSHIYRKMLNELDKQPQQMTPEIERDLHEEPAEADDLAQYLFPIVFMTPGDPLGTKIRAVMRAAWHDSPPMLLWLDIVEQEHRFPTQTEVADKAGLLSEAYKAKWRGSGVFNSQHWKPRWQKFYSVLWKDRRLMNALRDRLDVEGVELDESAPPSAADVARQTDNLLQQRMASINQRVLSNFRQRLLGR
jgi:hypothetical protein